MDLWPGRWAIFASMYVAQKIPPTEIWIRKSGDQLVTYSNNRVCELPACFLDFVVSLSTYVPSCLHRGQCWQRRPRQTWHGTHCQVHQVYRLQLGLRWLSTRQWQSSLEDWGGDQPKNSLDCPAGGLKPSGHCARPQLAAASLRIMAECLWKANRTALCGGKQGYFWLCCVF